MVHGTSPHHFFLETFSTYPPARLASNTITANAKNIPFIIQNIKVIGCKDSPNAFTQCKRIEKKLHVTQGDGSFVTFFLVIIWKL